SIQGNHFTKIPQWSSPLDVIPHTSLLTYSLINRVRLRTIAPEGTEAQRWEFLRFTVGQTYDFLNDSRPFGNIAGELIVDPSRIVRFRGETSLSPYESGFQTGPTDLALTLPAVPASVGTRYNRSDRTAHGGQDPMIPFLDLTRQHAALRAELMDAAGRVLDSARFILGPEGEALEQDLAKHVGVAHAIGVASGTDALRLALAAVGVGPGDEVITTAFSFVASASTIVMAGATPVFVDIDPATFALEAEGVARAVTPRTRAIVPVHLYG